MTMNLFVWNIKKYIHILADKIVSVLSIILSAQTIFYLFFHNYVPLWLISWRSILRTEGGPDRDPSGLMSKTVGADSGRNPKERIGHRSESVDSSTPLPLSAPLDLPCR